MPRSSGAMIPPDGKSCDAFATPSVWKLGSAGFVSSGVIRLRWCVPGTHPVLTIEKEDIVFVCRRHEEGARFLFSRAKQIFRSRVLVFREPLAGARGALCPDHRAPALGVQNASVLRLPSCSKGLGALGSSLSHSAGSHSAGHAGVPDYERQVIRFPSCPTCRCTDYIYANGCLCYSEGIGGIPPSCFNPVTTWRDASNKQVAMRWNDRPSIIYCGAGLVIPDCLTTPATCDARLPGSYEVDLSQPHCAPWRGYY
jgi:hypothetical protein